MRRSAFVALLASVVLSSGIGFAAAKLSEPDGARAAKSKAVVNQLNRLNEAVQTGNRRLHALDDSIEPSNGYLNDIERHTKGTCEEVSAGFNNDCSTFFSPSRPASG